MKKSGLIDRFNRRLSYIRISVTDRCNLRCMYCVPRDSIPIMAHDEILRYEELLRIVRIGVRLGISKVRVTGGEPLVRKGVCKFLADLSELKELSDISLTTNGTLLRENLENIKSAGIRRINISLDTMSRKKFEKITGFDRFDRAWEGIELSSEMGFSPLKINVVALKGVNDDEIEDFVGLTRSRPWHIRFIEHMPIGNASKRPPLLAGEILERIGRMGRLVPIESETNDGPADRYKLEGAVGEIGLIRPLSRHFCDKCNRLRLTAGGCLRTCLLSGRQSDLKTPLRNGCSDDDLRRIIVDAVQLKPSRHNIPASHSDRVVGRMSAIGG